MDTGIQVSAPGRSARDLAQSSSPTSVAERQKLFAERLETLNGMLEELREAAVNLVVKPKAIEKPLGSIRTAQTLLADMDDALNHRSLTPAPLVFLANNARISPACAPIIASLSRATGRHD